MDIAVFQTTGASMNIYTIIEMAKLHGLNRQNILNTLLSIDQALK